MKRDDLGARLGIAFLFGMVVTFVLMVHYLGLRDTFRYAIENSPYFFLSLACFGFIAYLVFLLGEKLYSVFRGGPTGIKASLKNFAFIVGALAADMIFTACALFMIIRFNSFWPIILVVYFVVPILIAARLSIVRTITKWSTVWAISAVATIMLVIIPWYHAEVVRESLDADMNRLASIGDILKNTPIGELYILDIDGLPKRMPEKAEGYDAHEKLEPYHFATFRPGQNSDRTPIVTVKDWEEEEGVHLYLYYSGRLEMKRLWPWWRYALQGELPPILPTSTRNH